MSPASDQPMTLQDRIESAMRDAMRARDERRTQTLRMAMSAAHNREIELGRSLGDDDYVDILSKQVKQRRESIEAFRAGGRDAMAANEEAEAAILAEFLPNALSSDELEVIVRAAIAETGASSPADLGKVMGKVVPQTKGRADGKAISDLVRQLLSA
jgi:uncharacterized protein YqeY